MGVGSAPGHVPCLCGAMLSAAPADIGREQACASCGARCRVIWAVDPRTSKPVPARVPVEAAGAGSAKSIRIPSGSFELVCACGQSLVARREHAGRKVKCPVCGASMDVETYKDPQTLETRIRRVDPSTKSGVIVPAKALGKTTARRVPGQDILCECGEYLRVSEEHLDKRAQCPACGTIMKLERHQDPQTSQTTVRARIVGKSAPPPKRPDPDAWSLDDFQ